MLKMDTYGLYVVCGDSVYTMIIEDSMYKGPLKDAQTFIYCL